MLSTKLVEIGHDVTVVDKLIYNESSLNHLYSFKNFNFINCDVRNNSKMKQLIKKSNYNTFGWLSWCSLM